MLAVIYYVMLAVSDVVIPLFTADTLLKKSIKLNKIFFACMAAVVMIAAYFYKIHYMILELATYVIILYTIRKKEKISWFYHIGFYLLINMILLPLVNIVAFFLFHGYMNMHYSFHGLFSPVSTEFICKMIYVLLLLVIQSQQIKKSNIFEKKYWESLYIFIFFCLSTLIVLMIITYNYHSTLFMILNSYLALSVIILIYIFKNFFVSFYESIEKMQGLIMDKEKMKLQMDSMIQYQERLEELKGFKHDIQNHFMVIKRMILQNRYEEAMRYINEYAGDFDALRKFVQTECLIVSAIINNKIQQYPDLEFQIKCFIPKHLGIQDADIVTVLGNLIDNSCEYMMRKNLKKTVQIRIMIYMETSLFIEVRNPYEEQSLSDHALLSQKADPVNHGYGLKNVQKAVTKYNGNFSIKAEDGYFLAQALLPLVHES